MAFKFSLILNVQINFSLKLKAIHIDLKLKVQDNARIVAILTRKKANNGCYLLWWIMCLLWWFIVTFRSNVWRSLQRCSCLSLKLLYAFENADSSHEERSLFLSVTTSTRWRKLQTAFAVGSNPLPSNEFIMHLYTSINEKYEFLVINILAMMEKDNITIEELFSLMFCRETRIDISKKKMKFYMICQLILLRET